MENRKIGGMNGRSKDEVVEIKSPTGEEIREILEKVAQNEIETRGIERPWIINPLCYRDYLVVEGYSKEKANKITLDNAKKQDNYTEEGIKKLKENLEK